LLLGWVVREGRERRRKQKQKTKTETDGDEEGEGEGEEEEVFVVDQVPACVPLLRFLRWLRLGILPRSRILFYCHFPDQLLARRDEGSLPIRLVKAAYRVPFDALEGWAIGMADRVVANSRFTTGVVRDVFGLGDVSVVYPCVDTEREREGAQDEEEKKEEGLWGGKKILLSINRFERKKNIELAIRAYHGLREEERRGTRLVIAGKSALEYLA
jgi:alpha-1,3/alpha-1,6-mannosyltransferase